jgi:dipeptidyl aminopeptidase/acylaminoacyl peptidase
MARVILASVLVAAGAANAVAQQAPVTHANWAQADRYTNEALQPMVYSTNLSARFIGKSDSLWYQWRDSKGTRFVLVVPATRTKVPLFDHARLAAALTAGGRPYQANNLPFTSIAFLENDHRKFKFLLDSTRFDWDMRTETLTSRKLTRQELTRERQELAAAGGGGGRGRGGGGGGGRGGGGGNQDFRNFSPDSTAYVYAMEHNLYLVETKGDTTPIKLTNDGVRFYSFGSRDTTQVQQDDDDQDQQQGQQQQQQQCATAGRAGGGGGGRGGGRGTARENRARADVTWSPDSKAFYVTRQDQRSVRSLYLVDVLCDPRPMVMEYKYAMPGEDSVAQQELSVFRRGEKTLTRLPVEWWKDQRLFDIHWPVNSEKLRLVRRDRLQRNMELIEVDIASKGVKSLLKESTENAFLERQNLRYVKAGGDFIWWSERSGWGHYYLYDFNGKLKNAITRGGWRAEQIVELDSVGRVLYLAGVGREEGENPYYRHNYRVNLDGTALTLLDQGNGTHTATFSPSRRFSVDNASRVDQAPTAVLRDATTGRQIMELEETDVTRLKEYGWKMPETFQVKAADGVTDIYGVMWKPVDFDPTKKYPIIAHVYPGPQTESVTYGFTATGVQQRLAQLGFIVIQIGNRGGSPQRSNAYHSYGYYNLRDYGLADKKAGMEQLAARFPWIDIERTGIYGHSGGGFMTAAALLQAPYNDFFKVGVSSAGNHDNNVYNQNWSEQHHGLRETRTPKKGAVANNTNGNNNGAQGNGPAAASGQQKAAEELPDSAYDIKFNIKVPANHELATNLKGRLLLVHGDMDNNVHPAGTIRLANALIKANKRFDFMVMPGKPHGFGDMQPYFTRMMFEYFSEHLLNDYYRGDATMRGK